MQQTIRSTSTGKERKATSATPNRRRQGLSLEPLIALGFFAIYLWMAHAMEGINFDTGFIALFCTFLSVFVVRCFHAAFNGGHASY